MAKKSTNLSIDNDIKMLGLKIAKLRRRSLSALIEDLILEEQERTALKDLITGKNDEIQTTKVKAKQK